MIDVQEKSYRIVRQFPLAQDFRFYLQGIAEWFVCEDAPLLNAEDRERWLQCFEDGEQCVLDDPTFASEETEYVVTGVRNKTQPTARYFDMCFNSLEEVLV